MMLLPLYFTDLRLPVADIVTASDASSRGGAVVQATRLTAKGMVRATGTVLDGTNTRLHKD